MARDHIALTIPDLSSFAKSLRTELQKKDDLPGHAAFLGLIAKAAGYQNHQHLRASQETAPNPQLAKAQMVFDASGTMFRWPKQTSVQELCLWTFWARTPDATDLSEAQINDVLVSGHSFGDHPLLRRAMIDHGMLSRTMDGRIYRKEAVEMPAPAAKLYSELAPLWR